MIVRPSVQQIDDLMNLLRHRIYEVLANGLYDYENHKNYPVGDIDVGHVIVTARGCSFELDLRALAQEILEEGIKSDWARMWSKPFDYSREAKP